MEVEAPDLLDALLKVGIALGEVRKSSGQYTIKGRRARAVTSREGDALQALILETFEYHGSVYDQLPDRLHGAPLGDYLPDTATIVARSSRVAEPFIAQFARDLVKRYQPATLLDIGSGTGIYVRHALDAAPALRAVAIDMQPAVVALAQKNFATWGIAERVTTRVADIRSTDLGDDPPFDLVTLYNNIYYFRVEERQSLFKRLTELLAPHGVICVVSLTAGGTVLSADLDLTLRSTAGCAPLPKLSELKEELAGAGMKTVSVTRLIPLEPLYGVVGTR
jgi:predicted O-methyltransferase YrrM